MTGPAPARQPEVIADIDLIQCLPICKNFECVWPRGSRVAVQGIAIKNHDFNAFAVPVRPQINRKQAARHGHQNIALYDIGERHVEVAKVPAVRAGKFLYLSIGKSQLHTQS